MVEKQPTDKVGLRQWALSRRAQIEMTTVSTALVAKLGQFIAETDARHILIYRAMPGEVDVSSLAEDTTRHWYLPRCAPKRRLAIHPFRPDVTPLRTGPFGILEPDPTLVPETEPTVLDLVVVPSLLLTPDGGRLGYGGGYYDRFLPQLRLECQTVGILPDTLIVATLPLDPWDVPLKTVITVPLP